MGRWAKSHDERKGQWLYNKLRPQEKEDVKIPISHKNYEEYITNRLFNMDNDEFDRLMEKYFD